MKYLALLLIFGFGLSGFGQTIKSLGYNTTNGQVVANTGTNVLTFTNTYVKIGTLIFNEDGIFYSATNGAGLDFQNTIFKDASGNVVFDYNYDGAAQFHKPIAFNNATNAAITRTNLGLGWSALTNTNAATSLLGFTTNGQVVANTGTNVLTFTNYHIKFAYGDVALNNQVISGTGIAIGFEDGTVSGSFFMDGGSIEFSSTSNAATTRANLGFSTNLNTLWTATNASNARSAVGLGATWLTNTDVNLFRESLDLGTNNAYFDKIKVFTESRGAISPPLTDNPEYGILYARETGDNIVLNIAPSGASGNYTISFDERLGSWAKTTNSATARTNLGLGGGITATNTFVSYNGTNYTTNTVTISNGIITGWTQ